MKRDPRVDPRQLEILQHALGLDLYGRGDMYRNQFCAGEDDELDCRALVAAGLMQEHRRTAIFPYYNVSVTDEGKRYVREHSPKPPKLTRGQVRYRSFVNWRDAWGGTFSEFLEWEKEERHA